MPPSVPPPSEIAHTSDMDKTSGSQGKAAESEAGQGPSERDMASKNAAFTSQPEGAGGAAAGTDGVLVRCGCGNVSVTVKMRESGKSGSPNAGGKSQGVSKSARETMVVIGKEVIRHKPLATFEPVDPERPSRSGPTIINDANGPSSTAEAVMVRRCWICETDLYTAKGQAREAVLAEGDMLEVDTSSAAYNRPAPSSPDPSFSQLTLDLPASTSSFGRPPSTSISTSTLYPSTSSSSTPHPHTRPTSLLPRLPDPFFLPPPFTPAHPLLHDWTASAVSFLTEAQDAAERDVRLYIESKAREMAVKQETTRKEVELMWKRYIEGPGRGDEMERRRSRSVSVSRRASRGRKVSGVAGGGFGAGMSVGGGAGQVRGSALDTDDPATGSSGLGSAVQGDNTPTQSLTRVQSQGQSNDNPLLREAQQTYTGGSLLSASISRNSYMPSLTPSTSRTSGNPSDANNNTSTSRAANAVDDDIDDLSQTVALQGDQRAVAMSYVFSGMDEMERRRQQAAEQHAQVRRGSTSRDRRDSKSREERKVDEAVDRVQSQQRDVHGKDSWIDEERNLAARYRPAAAVVELKGKKEDEDDDDKGKGTTSQGGDEADENSEGQEKEGKTPKPETSAAARPRVTFQETKPVREAKDGQGASTDGQDGDNGGDEGDDTAEDVEEDNVFDFELEDSPGKTNGADPAANTDAGQDAASAKAPARPKVQDMYESLLSTTLASDIPSHRAAHQRMKATGRNPYEFLRRRVSGTSGGGGDDDSLDGSEGSGSGSGMGTPRGDGGKDGRSLLATSMPVNIIMPNNRRSGARTADLPPLEPKTSLSERQGVLVPALRGAMRFSVIRSRSGSNAGAGSASGSGSGGGGGAGRTERGRQYEDDTPEATPRPRTHVQGFNTGPAPSTANASGSVQEPAGRTRRGSRSASVSRERETFRQDPGAVLELVGEGEDGDATIGASAGVNATAERGEMGDATEVERERRESMDRAGEMKKGFMPPHILARQESLRSDDVGWRSMISD